MSNTPPIPRYTDDDWRAVIEIGGYADPSTPAEWRGAGLIRLHLSGWLAKKDRFKLAKVPNGHWTKKSSYIAKPPLPAQMLNEWITRPEKNAMGIVPYFKGLCVIDIDADPVDVYRDQFIAEHGAPLVEINTPSGGLHLLYPIRASASNEAALADWPAGQIELNGEVIGEVPCASRFAAMWEPVKWAQAYRIRKAMHEAGEDDTEFSVKFLASSSLDWCNNQPAPSGVERVYEHRDTSDATRALLEAFVSHYDMQPNPAESGGYQGDCPVCPENGTGTRFKASIKGDSVVFYCFVCGCGSGDDKLAILDGVRRRGSFTEAEKAASAIAGSTADPEQASAMLAEALGAYPDLGFDQIEALTQKYWLDYNAGAVIRLAREKPVAKAEPVPDIGEERNAAIQRAIDLAQAPSTIEAILAIADRDGDRSKPELPMLAEIRRLAAAVDLPDYTALHEVKMLLNAGRAMGVKEPVLEEALKNYNEVWRKDGTTKMRNGDFPLALKFSTGLYDTKDDAIRAFRQHGGAVVPRSTEVKSSDGVMTAIRATGVKMIWSELDTALMVQHPDVGEWVNNKKCDPPEFTPLLQLQKGIVRSIGVVRGHKAPVLDGNGKPVMETDPATGEPREKTCTKYGIAPLMGAEMPGKAFAIKLLAQVGTEIPRVDYTAEMTRDLIRRRDSMTEEEREDCVELVQDWLNRIPYIKPVNAEGCADLIRLVSMIPYVVFAHRRLQFMGGGAKPYSQRLVPVFGGIHRVGKTTLAVNLFPSGGVFEGRISKDFAFCNDENNMKRRVNGKLLAINDELQGLSSTKPDVAKSFVTWSDGEYHQKFKNYDTMIRSDVLVGTTNKSNDIPADGALQDRFLFLHLEAADGYTDKQRHDGIIEWMEMHHERLMIGGLTLAERGVDLNPDEAVDSQRAAAAIDLDQSNNTFINAVNEVVNSGLYSADTDSHGPVISLCLVCLHAGLLKYQRDVRTNMMTPIGGTRDNIILHKRGDVIRPSDGGDDPDFEWSEDVQMAFKVRGNERNETGAITKVKEAIIKLHGVPDGLLRLNEPRSVEKWKRSRGKYYGFAVLDGRLETSWRGPREKTPF